LVGKKEEEDLEKLRRIAIEANRVGIPPSVLLDVEHACFLKAKEAPEKPAEKPKQLLTCTEEAWLQLIKAKEKHK